MELSSDRETVINIRRAAMNLLARREHSRHELQQKLISRFPQQKSLLILVIQQLADEDLQSDQRFARSFINARVARGYGLERIRMELEQKCVDKETVDMVIQNAVIDWQQILQNQFQKKYTVEACKDQQQKAKIWRSLSARGFSQKQLKELFKTTF